MVVFETVEIARASWTSTLERARFQDDKVVITSYGKPVAVVLSEGSWRRRALDLELDPDDVIARTTREARAGFRAVLNDARDGRATAVKFFGKEVVAVVAPLTMLSEDELHTAHAGPGT